MRPKREKKTEGEKKKGIKRVNCTWAMFKKKKKKKGRKQIRKKKPLQKAFQIFPDTFFWFSLLFTSSISVDAWNGNL